MNSVYGAYRPVVRQGQVGLTLQDLEVLYVCIFGIDVELHS
jgi:hypothetical protein